MSQTVAKFRQAVAAGAHGEAGVLLARYRAEVDRELAGLPPQSSEARQVVRQTQELIEWARRSALAERSRMETRRRASPRRCPYSAAIPIRRTWSLEG